MKVVYLFFCFFSALVFVCVSCVQAKTPKIEFRIVLEEHKKGQRLLPDLII